VGDTEIAPFKTVRATSSLQGMAFWFFPQHLHIYSVLQLFFGTLSTRNNILKKLDWKSRLQIPEPALPETM
jgi:hypothetical protein